jgi:negative regulator of sigma E activity
MKENLSALIDDELDDHTSQQVLDRLHADAQFRDEFALHMVIGDALRAVVSLPFRTFKVRHGTLCFPSITRQVK